MSNLNNNSGCGYAQLKSCGVARNPNHPSHANMGKPTSGVMIVPNYAGPSYDALTHGQKTPSCSGYFNITSAYPMGKSGQCNQQYSQLRCSGF